MTLIEIIAGLVVLAVLVSSVTIARGRFMRQWSQSQRKLEAAQALDRTLAGWLGGGGEADAIPVPAQGALGSLDGCIWRTSFITDPSAARLGAAKVRVDVFHEQDRLMSVEVLKHIVKRPTTREVAP